MKKLGLALGGGGLRGLAHIGVLQVLRENQVPVSIITGTSAGSIIASLYASGVTPAAMEEIVLQLKPRAYIDFNWLDLLAHVASGGRIPIDGFIKGNKLERLVFKLTGGRSLKDAGLPLAIIACDINTGQKTVFASQPMKLENDGDILITEALMSRAARASCAIPAVFTPVNRGDMQLVDGGVCEMVPILESRSLGAEYILAVNLGQEAYDQKVRGIIQVVGRSLSILEYETSSLAQDLLADQVVYPSTGDVALDDIAQASYLIRCGRRAMKAQLDELLENLNH
ncbi:MAG TPA: patatin-like phospholipase family protein [Syntrophomonas sp.]|nr:patatin-like phospholipase family protein [Syntrophomonas sp.]